MFQELLSEFVSSPQGQNALSALQEKGYSAEDATSFLEHGVSAAAETMEGQSAGQAQPEIGIFDLFGGHAGREFLAGAVAGIMRGEGVLGALEDGGIGLISGHVAEVIASRAGIDPATAGTIAAVVTPFIVHYAHEKLSSHPSIATGLSLLPCRPQPSSSNGSHPASPPASRSWSPAPPTERCRGSRRRRSRACR